MIQGKARIERVCLAVLVTVAAISATAAKEPPELKLPHVPLELSASAMNRPAALNTTMTAQHLLTAPQATRSFYESYLLPGLEKQISRVGVLHTWVLDRPDLGQHSDHEALAQVSERMFEKGASRALRSYLSEITGLETMVLNLAGRNGRLGDGGKTSRFNLGIGVSSALPRVDIGYRIGDAGTFRLSLCADGAVDLNYGHYGRLSSTRFYATYDTSEETADIGLRVSF
jgi:hypothetical protein